MMDFNFRTLNIESLAQKNKEEARQAFKQMRRSKKSRDSFNIV